METLGRRYNFHRPNIMFKLVYGVPPAIFYDEMDSEETCEEAVRNWSEILFTQINSNPLREQYANLEEFREWFDKNNPLELQQDTSVMHELNNLPMNDNLLKDALVKLNESAQKNPELAHYILQWTIANVPPAKLHSLVRCVQTETK